LINGIKPWRWYGRTAIYSPRGTISFFGDTYCCNRGDFEQVGFFGVGIEGEREENGMSGPLNHYFNPCKCLLTCYRLSWGSDSATAR
jgi:hypothetical protein